MNINYDVVVVGAGNAGLVAALKASKEGKKVLLIDNNNIPGGIATSTLKGNFEFENSLHKLTGIMTDDNKGVIRKANKNQIINIVLATVDINLLANFLQQYYY